MSTDLGYQQAVAQFDEPEGIGPRGTLVVLPGRGERPLVYERFARRLAADGYRVRIVGEDAHADAQAQLDSPSAMSPRILVGIDVGALRALHLVQDSGLEANAVILVGLPTGDDAGAQSWDDEIGARASCPTQQARLNDPNLLTPGQLTADRIPEELRTVTLRTGLPVLALHGVDDAVSPLSNARARYAESPNVRLLSVAQGRHDVLNSLNHRTVAASVVLFLESLKIGSELPDLIRKENLR
ncbi:alpha/beta hydrolase [Rhodococcus wratislaviensis]|uniref:alpha/beta hydrolase n=1 Tax=Rhodococcus wratislaviensis TaxID=44752 RepID=UPI00364D4A58